MRLALFPHCVNSSCFATAQVRTLLHIAAHNGHTDIICYLIELGALVDCLAKVIREFDLTFTPNQSLVYYQDQRTPLHYACLGGHVEAAAALIEHGADVNAGTGSVSSSLRL